jgi:hypothetical protein
MTGVAHMFMQVIRGRVADEAGLRKSFDRWMSELRPGAEGYLGTTAGFTDDGEMIALARFESAAAAKHNSDRPEQSKWAAEVGSELDGEPTFIDIDDAHEWLGGGSDDAGFVQVMIGQSPDVQALLARSDEEEEQLRAARPEIIGGTFGRFGDNGYVQAVYFRSEDAAREKESSEPPPEVKAMVEDFQRLLGDVTYVDLHKPLLYSR